MEQVKSPYNFVPAPSEDQVFKPDWANQVSHDIPFEDGESGELEITITAETPIFIRNGHAQGVEDNEFSHIGQGDNKQYFIPATSIKGMLRNVLEIMSFSRMKQVDRSPFYGLRDMNNREYKFETNQNELKSGWLKLVNGNWIVEEVQHVRVSMQDIEAKYQIRDRKIQKAETALQKYSAINGSSLDVKTSFERNLIKRITGKPDLNYGKLYKFSKDGEFSGTLVLYGNIGNKHYDFVFGHEVLIIYNIESTLISNMEKLEQSLWDYHKPRNRIPVFFRTDNNKVIHFGFSKLYRLNNGNTIGDLSPKYEYEKGKDLAELIFGYTNEENDSLKGRVFISNAFCSDITVPENIETRVLSTPKPSYYPSYLKQDSFKPDGSINIYKTFVNKTSELAGFKRYPVHTNTKPNGNHENENIPSSFKPLPAKTIFNCKIRFHNLKRIELGALISSITFHDNLGYSHTIGGAKPYGFGKVKIEVNKIEAEYLDSIFDFENRMNEHINDKVQENLKWLITPQIIELFSNSKPNQATEENLVYPRLKFKNEDNKDKNEFVEYKKNNLFIVSTSDTNGIPTIKPFKSQKMLGELILTFNLENINTFSDLQNKIREELSDNVPDNLHQLIISKIKEIYKGHKDSRKKLSKPFDEYFVKTPIIKWLGEIEAKILYTELTKS